MCRPKTKCPMHLNLRHENNSDCQTISVLPFSSSCSGTIMFCLLSISCNFSSSCFSATIFSTLFSALHVRGSYGKQTTVKPQSQDHQWFLRKLVLTVGWSHYRFKIQSKSRRVVCEYVVILTWRA